MYVRAGRPAFARPCVGIHKSTSLMSSSLLLQQCPACLVRLTWTVFVIGGRWPYSWYLVGSQVQSYVFWSFCLWSGCSIYALSFESRYRSPVFLYRICISCVRNTNRIYKFDIEIPGNDILIRRRVHRYYTLIISRKTRKRNFEPGLNAPIIHSDPKRHTDTTHES